MILNANQYNILLNLYGIHKVRAWISGWVGRIHPQNLKIPSKKSWGRETPALKNPVFWKLLFLRNKTSHFRKICWFSLTLDSFLVSVVISYCRLEVTVFQSYQKLNAVRSKNLELSCGISHILLVFGEITVYLCKMIMDLKNINCRKNSHFGN